MPEKMAIEHGIQPHERSAYLRIDRAKGNNSRIKPPRWVTFVNQPLPQGDDVGVLIPWKPPALDGNSEVMEWAENVFLAILARFNAEGRRPSDRKGVAGGEVWDRHPGKGHAAPARVLQDRHGR
jgi:hypothetical protein